MLIRMRLNQKRYINVFVIILLFLLIYLYSCSAKNKEKLYNNLLRIELTEGCVVQWDSVTWNLNYSFNDYADSLDVIKGLTNNLLDTTKTEIVECYFYLNEDSVKQNLTIGQISFWILWRELKIPIRDKFLMELTTFGPNIKDTVPSSCLYSVYMMEWAHFNRQAIQDTILNNNFNLSSYSPRYTRDTESDKTQDTVPEGR